MNLPLIVGAVQRWRALSEELGCDLELTEDGYLWVAMNEKDLEMERVLVERDSHFGIKEYILDQSHVKELAPAISDIVYGGLYSPTDLIANPFLVAKGYYTNAQRYGAKFLFDTEVTGLTIEGNQIRGLSTTRGEIATNLIINAAGPWSDRIGHMAGIEIPSALVRTNLLSPSVCRQSCLLSFDQQHRRLSPIQGRACLYWEYERSRGNRRLQQGHQLR